LRAPNREVYEGRITDLPRDILRRNTRDYRTKPNPDGRKLYVIQNSQLALFSESIKDYLIESEMETEMEEGRVKSKREPLTLH